jgi:hypothetical protein
VTGKKGGSAKAEPRRGGRNLGIQIAFRAVDEAQKARWHRAAARAGVTLNEWLRALADDASKGR